MNLHRLFFTATIGFATLIARANIAWMEGEEYASSTLGEEVLSVGGWGNKSVLSKEKWLNISIDAGKVLEKVPEEGGLLTYSFSLEQEGAHDVWARVGYEFIRSSFDWRVDGGEWASISHDDPLHYTQDLMLLQDWCEVGWAPLGSVSVSAGEHMLQIRLMRPYKDAEKKQVDRIITSFDALVVAPQGAFRPNGPHQPGEAWRTPEDLAAEAHRFELPEAPAKGARAELSLSGRWQYARWSEAEAIHSLMDMDEASRAATPRVLPGGGSILVDAEGKPVIHRAGPIPICPSADALDWSSIVVPGDRNRLDRKSVV